jgi:hypothetical protein
MRKYKGNRPSDLWSLAGSVDADAETWDVYVRNDPVPGWTNIKLCAAGRVPGKGNYWLSRRGPQWWSARDMVLLRGQRPQLIEPVERVLLEREAADLW